MNLIVENKNELIKGNGFLYKYISSTTVYLLLQYKIYRYYLFQWKLV